MAIKTCFVVLGSLLSFLGCSSREDSLPVFPQTDNAAVQVSTPPRAEERSRTHYKQFVQYLLPTNGTPLRGIQTDRFNYVLLPYGTGNAFFDLNGLAYSGRIGWTTWQLNKGLHFPQPGRSFIREGYKAQDSNLTLTCQGSEHTSSVADDFAGRSTNDYLMQVQVGPKRPILN